MTNWKNRNTDPPAKYLIPICEFLDVSPYYLLTGKEKSPSTELNDLDKRCLNALHNLNHDDKIEFISKMEQRAADYPPEVKGEIS